MKTSFLLFWFILVFTSCSKKDDNVVSNDLTRCSNDSIRNYVNSKGIMLQIKKSIWYTEKINGFGNVNLEIIGSTNAERLTVQTFGDGLISDVNVVLDSKNNFSSEKIGISFTHDSTVDYITQGTIIKAYKGSDTLYVTIQSGRMKY